MPRRSVGGHIRRHWLAIALAVFVLFSEALILTQFPIDRTDVSEATQNAGHSQEAGRQIPPLAFAWVPIRARLLNFVRINLLFIDRYHDTLNAVSTLAVAIFTATLWSTTRGLYSSGEKQITLANRNAAAAERAAEVATAALIGGSRAWIKVTIKMTDGLEIAEDEISAVVSIECENVGSTPAIRVSQHVWIRPWDVSLIQPSDDIRIRAIDSKSENSFHEFVMFAGERFPDITQAGTWSIIVKTPIDEIWRNEVQKGEGIFTLLVMGCVNYTFPSDPSNVHQTRFLYEIWRNKAERFRLEDFPLDRKSFIFRKTLIAAGDYAD